MYCCLTQRGYTCPPKAAIPPIIQSESSRFKQSELAKYHMLSAKAGITQKPCACTLQGFWFPEHTHWNVSRDLHQICDMYETTLQLLPQISTDSPAEHYLKLLLPLWRFHAFLHRFTVKLKSLYWHSQFKQDSGGLFLTIVVDAVFHLMKIRSWINSVLSDVPSLANWTIFLHPDL